MDKNEFILCAAADYNGHIVCGYRHGDCNRLLEGLLGIDETLTPGREKQGFMTSLNRFVDRKEAWKIALANNQIKFGLKASDNGEDSELISENLY
jgi:hypothetical protein